ncbi:hypothetical protein B296_00049447 [Ensete ventricosum]|uniref:Uncharacterized protein n=1 Tax=Ensete ventricosum TaxID=4639 RepID=A0A426YNF8_ENSVE|nr:hypothetical protein B296_00049447 [Ensete ventricosum]
MDRAGGASSQLITGTREIFTTSFNLPPLLSTVTAALLFTEIDEGVVGHSYLATLLPLWLTMPSYPSTTPVVLTVRHASAGKGVDLTGVRSVVRPLAPPYWRPTSFPRRVSHIGRPVVRGPADVAARSPFAISFSPPWEDLLEVPDEGAEDEVLCLAAGPWWLWTSPEWELKD